MDKKQYINELFEAFEANRLDGLLNQNNAEKLYEFSSNLIETNKQFNLTAITDEIEIIIKHFVDCASIAPLIQKNAKVIDIGCGAGFPSIPLAILRSDLKITALDSTQKRITFVNNQAKALNLNNIEGICARAEDYSTQVREDFDVCTSRAVARLNILSELCIPYTKVGGTFIAMKSIKGDEEYAEAKAGIKKLGCELTTKQLDEFKYQEISSQRTLFVFKKVTPTPHEFPRKYSQIVKKPL